MSKSKGNGVDPMDLIAKYGADAMRFNLLTLVTNNQDVRFDADIDPKTHELISSPRTEQARAFVTKIWNASRFVLGNLEGLHAGRAPLLRRLPMRGSLSRLAGLSERGPGHFRIQFRVRWPSTRTRSSGTSSATGTSSSRRRACARAPIRLLACKRSAISCSCSIPPCAFCIRPCRFVTEALWEQLPHAEERKRRGSHGCHLA